MAARIDDRTLMLRLVGGTMLLVGLLFGLLPVSVEVRGDDVSCGNAWFLRYDEGQALGDRLFDAAAGGRSGSQGQSKCKVEAGSRGTIGFVLGGIGAAALLGSMLIAPVRRDA